MGYKCRSRHACIQRKTSFPPHPLIIALTNRKNRTRQFIRKNHDKINIISWFWKDDVRYRIERCDKPNSFNPNVFQNEEYLASSYVVSPNKSKLKLYFGKLLSPKVNLYEILACPICKNRIKVGNSILICLMCKKKFPVINDVPMMIKEYAY